MSISLAHCNDPENIADVPVIAPPKFDTPTTESPAFAETKPDAVKLAQVNAPVSISLAHCIAPEKTAEVPVIGPENDDAGKLTAPKTESPAFAETSPDALYAAELTTPKLETPATARAPLND